MFVAIPEVELSDQLESAPVKSGRLVETAELKAIRESILSVRMSDWLQLPREEAWLRDTMETIGQVLTQLWKTTADMTGAPIRADWLFSHLDIRGWTHSFPEDIQSMVEKLGPILYYFKLLTAPSGIPAEMKKRYWRWLDERVLKPMKEQEPELYGALLDVYRRYFASIVDAAATEEG